MAVRNLPPLPYSQFPLRPHQNGQWYKSVWNRLLRKSQQFYFGAWQNDLKGDRALKDPQAGWLARKDAIHAGLDNLRVGPLVPTDDLTLGELMARFLVHKRNQVRAGELSLRTLGDYIVEVQNFVGFQNPGTPASLLKTEHFSAYVRDLVERRKLGRHARKRVRAYVNAFLHYGSGNGWFAMPATGIDWKAPSTDADSIRLAKARSGIPDHSERIFTGAEIDMLMSIATPTFRAMILLGLNCGLGPADIARLRWRMMDMDTGKLTFPRPKTGVKRIGYLWKKTRRALSRVAGLKHNQAAIDVSGSQALVFVTRNGHSYYRDEEKHQKIVCGDVTILKLTGVKTQNSISNTFYRMCRETEISGGSFYRCRHTFRTLAAGARDREAVDLMMGHAAQGMARVYDHSQVNFVRIKRVAKKIHIGLWDIKSKEGTTQERLRLGEIASGEEERKDDR